MKQGDAIVFYHGKKARRAETDSGPVRPYQLTMAGYIEGVDQDESGEVTYFGYKAGRVRVAFSANSLFISIILSFIGNVRPDN